jgi:hypothetical protein
MIHGWSALGGLTMAEWEDELEQWLKPFLDRLGHKTRQRMCPLYVAGLIGPSEQAHQQLKEELGLYHFEGRSWQGLHRHALMTMIAYAFLQHRRLAHAGRKKRINGPPPQPTMPALRHAIVDLILRGRLSGVRTAENKSLKNSGANTFCQRSVSACRQSKADFASDQESSPPGCG